LDLGSRTLNSVALGASPTEDPGTAADEPPPHADPTPVALKPETIGQRANRLATIYTDLVPLSKFIAVSQIVTKACAAYDDQQITDGLLKLVDEKRSVTADTLRIAIEGAPRSSASNHQGFKNPINHDDAYSGTF
jgi:hypothetical protein